MNRIDTPKLLSSVIMNPCKDDKNISRVLPLKFIYENENVATKFENSHLEF